jgi:hypothetical protein
VRTRAGTQAFLDLCQIFFGFSRQGGFDLFEKRFQGIMKDGVFLNPEHVPSKIKGDEFREAERNGNGFSGRLHQAQNLVPLTFSL